RRARHVPLDRARLPTTTPAPASATTAGRQRDRERDPAVEGGPLPTVLVHPKPPCGKFPHPLEQQHLDFVSLFPTLRFKWDAHHAVSMNQGEDRSRLSRNGTGESPSIGRNFERDADVVFPPGLGRDVADERSASGTLVGKGGRGCLATEQLEKRRSEQPKRHQGRYRVARQA